jgi:NAD(P)H-flavin reductase
MLSWRKRVVADPSRARGRSERDEMTLATYEARYLGKSECGATGLFRFERPRSYEAAAGQWFRLTLDTRDGEQTKTFSDAAAPMEVTLDLTTRLSGSAFKDALLDLSDGHVVRVGGPGGRLVVAEETRYLAFLMGGVGIAPGRAIIRDHVLRGEPRTSMTLLLGNNEETCIPFVTEFEDYDERLPWFEFVDVVAKPGPGRVGEAGFITAEVVDRHLDLGKPWEFMVAGPPAMIEPMRVVLDDLEIPSERRHFETFSGYTSA